MSESEAAMDNTIGGGIIWPSDDIVLYFSQSTDNASKEPLTVDIRSTDHKFNGRYVKINDPVINPEVTAPVDPPSPREVSVPRDYPPPPKTVRNIPEDLPSTSSPGARPKTLRDFLGPKKGSTRPRKLNRNRIPSGNSAPSKLIVQAEIPEVPELVEVAPEVVEEIIEAVETVDAPAPENNEVPEINDLIEEGEVHEIPAPALTPVDLTHVMPVVASPPMLPFVNVYLLGNNHLNDRNQLTKVLRRDIHPNVVLDNKSTPGGRINGHFQIKLDDVVKNEYHHSTGRDSYVIVLCADNDLRASLNPELLANLTIDKLRAAALMAPKLRFIIMGCVPSTTIPANIVKTYNRTMSLICRRLWFMHGFYFLNFNLVFNQQSDPAEFFLWDQIHLTHTGGNRTAGIILQLLNPLIHGQFGCDPPALVQGFPGRNGSKWEMEKIRELGNAVVDPIARFFTPGVMALPWHMRKHVALRWQGGFEWYEKDNEQFRPDVPFSLVKNRIIRHSQVDNSTLAANTSMWDHNGEPICLCGGLIDCYPCRARS